MMANNSSGARSVLYGKTIDHVRDAAGGAGRRIDGDLAPLAGRLLAEASRGESIVARALRDVPALAQTHAAEIDRRFPKVLRRVGGYNLDAFVDPPAPVDLSRLMVGSEGTLGFVPEATVGLVPLPAVKALVTLEFDDLLEALGATPEVLRHRSVGGRGDGRLHPPPRPRPRRARRHAARHRRRREPGPAVRGVLRRPPRPAAAAARRLRARHRLGASGRAGAAADRARRRRGSGTCARPRSGCRWRCPAMPRRCRSSRTRRWRRNGCATTSRASSNWSRATAPSPASTPTPRSAACTCGRWSTSRPRPASPSSRASPATSPTWCSNSAAPCRANTATGWSAAPSTSRCSAPRSTRRSAP